MADLPAGRVQKFRLFVHVGVDYAMPGPLQMQEHRLRKSRTHTLFILPFLSVRVRRMSHLEVFSDISTEVSLMASDRLSARNVDIRARCIRTAERTSSAPLFSGFWKATVRLAKQLFSRWVVTRMKNVRPFYVTSRNLLTHAHPLGRLLIHTT